MQNWKKHNKQKMTLFVNTPVLTVLVKMSVFAAFLNFSVLGISMFFRNVFDRFPKFKRITKYESNKKQKTTTTRKQDAKQKHI